MSCYYYLQAYGGTAMSSASQKCKSYGARLPVIKSAVENNFIYNLLLRKGASAGAGVFIGLVRQQADKKFYWIDGTLLEGHFEAWNVREPNNYGGKENCAQVYRSNSKWNDLPCGSGSPIKGILCQKPM